MPDDPLQQILRLVADGRLSAAEAAPILEALESRRPGEPSTAAAGTDTGAERSAPAGTRHGGPRYARIEVTERGRRAVDLRIPLSIGRRALNAIPGLSAVQASELGEAVERGLVGPVIDITDEDGDGVRIGLE
jgi:hypothetical protein